MIAKSTVRDVKMAIAGDRGVGIDDFEVENDRHI
jgi:hypothetical protein